MKKILLFLFFAMPLMGFAQKSYVHIFVKGETTPSWESGSKGHAMYLTGDIPSGINDRYSTSNDMTVGKLMSLLGEKGYELEKAIIANEFKEIIIMSKSGSSSYSKIQSINTEDEGEPYEVARYNLQGIPVKANEKGVQIIIFSNYTTKTVIVE
jgi:hypothetical protein